MAGDSTSLAGWFSMLSNLGAADSDNACITKVHEEKKSGVEEPISSCPRLLDLLTRPEINNHLESPHAVYFSQEISMNSLFRQ